MNINKAQPTTAGRSNGRPGWYTWKLMMRWAATLPTCGTLGTIVEIRGEEINSLDDSLLILF